jgi:hypothetical protein
MQNYPTVVYNVVPEQLELFVYCGPVHTKLKWSILINEHTHGVPYGHYNFVDVLVDR